MTITYCPSCHKQIQSTFAGCPYCHKPLVKENFMPHKHPKKSSVFNDLKKYLLISLGIAVALFLLFFIWAINSTPSYTPSSTSTAISSESSVETATNSEPDIESQTTETAIPMSSEHENNRYFLLSHTSKGNIEKVTYVRKGKGSDEYDVDVYGVMEINCRKNKIRKYSTESFEELNSPHFSDWVTPYPEWTDNDIVTFICS